MANDDAAKDNWLGFSCPVCHILFRVPRESAGTQVECPSCAGIVVIPREDAPPLSRPKPPRAGPPDPPASQAPSPPRRRHEARPEKRAANQFRTTEEVAKSNLVIREQRTEPGEDENAGRQRDWEDGSLDAEKVVGPQLVRRKHRKKPLEETEEPDWEKEEDPREGAGGAVISQTVLLGGMAILIFLAGLVALVLLREKDPKDVKILQERLPGRTSEEISNPAVPEESEPIEADWKEALEEIEVAVKRFLSAKTVDEMITLVRVGEELEPRIRSFYQKAPLVPFVPRSVAKSGSFMRSGNKLFAVDVELRDFSIRPLALEKTEKGYLVDWESWVGYSELSWEEMQEKRPQEPKLFRVRCSMVNYYNFGFADSEWRAFRLRSPNGEHVLYAYAPRYSIQESMLSSVKGARGKGAAYTLMIHYPENAPNGNQVLIAEVVEPGWIARELKSEASQK